MEKNIQSNSMSGRETAPKAQAQSLTPAGEARRKLPDGRQEWTFRFTAQETPPRTGGEVLVEWTVPALGLCGCWTPDSGTRRDLRPDWRTGFSSATTHSAPVICCFDDAGGNRYTVAVTEVKKETSLLLGVREEDGMLCCGAQVRGILLPPGEDYVLTVLLDARPVRYEQALRDVADWWLARCGIEPMAVPSLARQPMYSTWYAYHQDLYEGELEAECARARELGLGAVLVDDGWQTEDNGRGYAYCGDWNPAPSRFADFPAHVRRVHEAGLKVILWFSVAFVGFRSAAWPRFEDKLLARNEALGTGVVDPRYPEVRAYLTGLYERAVREWGVDGLKLDFVDEFYLREDSPAPNERMDYVDVQDATDRLMTDISRRLSALNPELLIEFRQRYIGPVMRRYGNMFRVADCPYSGLTNRVGTVDLRLLSGSTAPHGDMLMWHGEEDPADVALQIENSLFGTLQLSVRLDRTGEEQKKVMRHLVRFAREHEAALLEGTLTAHEPQNLYPAVESAAGCERVVALYSAGRAVELHPAYARTFIFNATHSREVLLVVPEGARAAVRRFDCAGEQAGAPLELAAGCHRVPAPPAGLLEVQA